MEKVRLTRRGMLGLSAKGAGLFALGASGLAVPRGFAGGGGGGSVYIEAFPTSPLILDAFSETPAKQLNIPPALRPMSDADMGNLDHHPLDSECQDSFAARGVTPQAKGLYWDK